MEVAAAGLMEAVFFCKADIILLLLPRILGVKALHRVQAAGRKLTHQLNKPYRQSTGFVQNAIQLLKTENRQLLDFQGENPTKLALTLD